MLMPHLLQCIVGVMMSSFFIIFAIGCASFADPAKLPKQVALLLQVPSPALRCAVMLQVSELSVNSFEGFA